MTLLKIGDTHLAVTCGRGQGIPQNHLKIARDRRTIDILVRPASSATESMMQVPTEQPSENQFSLRQRSRTCSLSWGSQCRAVTRTRRPPSLCLHVPTQGPSTTRVHVENPNRSHFGDDWCLNKSNVPSIPPSPPLIESACHNGRERFLLTGTRDRVHSLSRLLQGSDKKYIEITDEESQLIADSGTSGRPHARTDSFNS